MAGPSNVVGILDALKDVLTTGAAVSGHLVAGNSLTQYTKAATIQSTAYVDRSLEDCPVLGNILLGAQNAYAGMITTAFQMQNFVTGTKTVADYLKIVSTEDMIDYDDFSEVASTCVQRHNDIADKLFNYAQEDDTSDAIDGYSRGLAAPDRPAKPAPDYVFREGKDIQDAKPGSLPFGKTIQVVLANPDNKNASVTLNLTVQVVPKFVSATVAPEFIARGTSLRFRFRYLQARAGEKSYLKDLLFNLDSMKKGAALVKDDKDGALQDFINSTAAKDRNSTWQLLTRETKDLSKNMANRIMIFSDEAVRTAYAQSGINLYNDGDRHRYFRDTYTMMIFIVDPTHQIVELFLNGINGSAQYPFSAFKDKNDKDVLKEVILALASGRVPRAI